MTISDSVRLYKKFLQNRKRLEVVDFIDNLEYSVGINPLEFDDFNEKCYREMYEKFRTNFGNERTPLPKEYFFTDELEVEEMCLRCKENFLKEYRRKKELADGYVKQKDMDLAGKIEDMFIDFLNFDMNIRSIRGNKPSNIVPDANVGYPDVLVLNENSKKLCYCEMKYNAAPYVKQKPPRVCYEGSLTLNPRKLERHHEMRQTGRIEIPIYYVYIADFPCIKGVFFSTIDNIWLHYQNVGYKPEHDRKAFGGDFVEGRKIGQTRIIYPPLLCLDDFGQLINTLHARKNE